MRKPFLVLLFLTAGMLVMSGFAGNFEEKEEKTVILIRHAKSLHDSVTVNDFDRPLEKRGEKDADKTGKFLAKKKINIDLIVASPSVRTKQTIARICTGLHYDESKVVYDSTIYRCAPEAVLAVIQKTDPSLKTIVIVGHNPATTDIANRLQENKKWKEVPTTGVVAIKFKNTSWKDVGVSKGKLWFFSDPDEIK